MAERASRMAPLALILVALSSTMVTDGMEINYAEEVMSLADSPKETLLEMKEGAQAMLKVGAAAKNVKMMDYGEEDDVQAADPMAAYLAKCAVCPAVCPAGTSCDK